MLWKAMISWQLVSKILSFCSTGIMHNKLDVTPIIVKGSFVIDFDGIGPNFTLNVMSIFA